MQGSPKIYFSLPPPIYEMRRNFGKPQNNVQSIRMTPLLVKKVLNRVGDRGLHGPDFSVRARPGPHGYNLGPARSKEKNFCPGPARPEREIKI